MRIQAYSLLWLSLALAGAGAEAEASLFKKNGVDQGITAFEEGNYSGARRWLSDQEAAEDPRAWYYLGQLYQQGLGGFPLDIKRAERLYHRAAEEGQPSSMLALADMFARGAGVQANRSVARVWYEKAAKAGSVPAMLQLAYDLTGQYGLPPDYAKARVWFEQAAAEGNSEAMVGLATLYRNGRGVEVNRVEALKWYRLALRYGEPEAGSPEALLRQLTSSQEQAQADQLVQEWEGLVGLKGPGTQKN